MRPVDVSSHEYTIPRVVKKKTLRFPVSVRFTLKPTKESGSCLTCPLKSSSKKALAGMDRTANATAAANETPNVRVALAFMRRREP